MDTIETFGELLCKNGFSVMRKFDSSTGRAFVISDDGNTYFAKIKNSLKQTQTEQALLTNLSSKCIITPQILNIFPINNDTNKPIYLVLYEYIHLTSGDELQVEAVGQSISRLHEALRKEYYSNYVTVDVFRNASEVCVPYICKCSNQIRKIFDLVLSSERYNIEKITRMLPMQLVHGDLHYNNIFDYNHQANGQIGFIDFENAFITYRIFDLAYYLLSFLKKGSSIADWFIQIETLLNSYIGITEDEITILYDTMQCIVIMKLANAIKHINKPMMNDAVSQLILLYDNKAQLYQLKERLI